MKIANSTIKLKEATRFYGTWYFQVFLRAETDFKSISFVHRSLVEQVANVVSQDGNKYGLTMQVLLKERCFPEDAKIVVKMKSGRVIKADFRELLREGAAEAKSGNTATRAFHKLVERGGLNVLDLGGRDRSQIDRSKQFPDCDVTVFDVLPGDNVDVVGDAHELSKHFDADTFDFVFSVSVFEHLLMPWKVVLEMNKVLKPGGHGFIWTHQTLGMHDIPWDFWRFSDTAWDGLLNKFTGFEILDRSLVLKNYILPLHYREDMDMAEESRGFEGSGVFFRKISGSDLEWNTPIGEIIETHYPS